MECIEMVHNQFGPKGLPRSFGAQPTEEDFLFLSDVFITNGFHYIQVGDVSAGRAMINGFIQSMKIYNKVACLTMADAAILEPSIINLATELHQNNISTEEQCQEFILEQLYADFMWIELTQEIQEQEWFEPCISAIIDLGIHQQIPILTISC